VLVPKNNANWHGPWDCAEFMSWIVFQGAGILYGCVDDNANPASVEAYTTWLTTPNSRPHWRNRGEAGIVGLLCFATLRPG
jgi:hypothetical protein